MKCSHCEQDFESLENWGEFNLCVKCLKIYEALPKKPPSEISDIKIFEPALGHRASYNARTGDTKLMTIHENDALVCINHEFIHYILHKLISIRCSYQFDNFEKEVDVYHSSGGKAND